MKLQRPYWWRQGDVLGRVVAVCPRRHPIAFEVTLGSERSNIDHDALGRALTQGGGFERAYGPAAGPGDVVILVEDHPSEGDLNDPDFPKLHLSPLVFTLRELSRGQGGIDVRCDCGRLGYLSLAALKQARQSRRPRPLTLTSPTDSW